MALDGLFFAGVDRVHATHKTPAMAIAVLAATSLVLVAVLRSFPSVLDYTTFAILLATIATPRRSTRCAGRRRIGPARIEPGATRSCRTLHRRERGDRGEHAGLPPARVRYRAGDAGARLPFYWWFTRRPNPIDPGPA